MKRQHILHRVPLALTVLTGLLAACIYAGEPSFEQGAANFRLKGGHSLSEIESLIGRFHVTLYDSIARRTTYFADFPDTTSVDTVVAALRDEEAILWAEPNYVGSLASNDSLYPSQWHLEHQDNPGSPWASIHAAEAWCIEKGDCDIRLAAQDTGIPYDDSTGILLHEDLLNETGYCEIELRELAQNDRFNDGFGHGTIIAGIMAARTNNIHGVAGIAYECGLVVYSGGRSSQRFAACIEDCIDPNGGNAAVYTNSWGDIPWNQTMRNAAEDAEAAGLVITAAVGNFTDSPDPLDAGFPCAWADTFSNVLCVGGTDSQDHLWNDDTLGALTDSMVNISAPAHLLVSTSIEQVGWYVHNAWGTSFATPMVAAVAGLVISQAEESGISLTAQEVRDIITASADDCNWNIGHPGRDDSLGYGRLNAFKALLRTPGRKELESDLTIPPHYYDAVSPYYLADGLVVPATRTLTIEAGTRITFGPNAYIEVQGNLVVTGVQGDSVRFVASNGNVPWQGIHIAGGQAHISYAVFQDATMPVFSENATGSQIPFELSDSRIKGGQIGLRISGNPLFEHHVDRVTIHDVPNVSPYVGLYFYNTLVKATDLHVLNSGYRTGYILNTTGKITRGVFRGATANYGLALSGSTTGMVFRCCEIDHIAPAGFPSAAVWCIGGAAPVFGETGTPMVNNRIVDNRPYLIRFDGTAGRPIVSGRSNILVQESLPTIGKFFIWTAYTGGRTYDARMQYWGGATPQITMFDPPIAQYWDFSSPLANNPGLCGGLGGTSGFASLLDSAIVLEEQEQWSNAQGLYLAIAGADSFALGVRAAAAARAVMVDRETQAFSIENVNELSTDLKSSAQNLTDTLAVERTRLAHLIDENSLSDALNGYENLLSVGLSSEDSLLTLIDIYHVQMLAASGSSLDEAVEPQNSQYAVHTTEQGEQMVNAAFDALMALGSSPPDVQPLPTEFVLYPNYPNPFNPVTEIRFDLPEKAQVEVTIFNTLGQRVATLVNDSREAGTYRVQWDGSNAASGMYLCQLKAVNFVQTRKMLLLK